MQEAVDVTTQIPILSRSASEFTLKIGVQIVTFRVAY
jgi:hypothetical protein